MAARLRQLASGLDVAETRKKIEALGWQGTDRA